MILAGVKGLSELSPCNYYIRDYRVVVIIGILS